MSLGHVVIAGHRFEIESLALRNGQVEVTFAITGPRPAFTGPITVFGADGRGCWQGKTYIFPEFAWWQMWTFTYGITQTQVLTGNEVCDLTDQA